RLFWLPCSRTNRGSCGQATNATASRLQPGQSRQQGHCKLDGKLGVRSPSSVGGFQDAEPPSQRPGSRRRDGVSFFFEEPGVGKEDASTDRCTSAQGSRF